MAVGVPFGVSRLNLNCVHSFVQPLPWDFRRRFSLLESGSPSITPTAAATWTKELGLSVGRWSQRFCEIRRHLHQNPEPSGSETHTTRYIASCLASQSLRPVIAPGGRGLWVDVGGQALATEVSDGDDPAAKATQPDAANDSLDSDVASPCPWRLGIRGDIDGLWIGDEKAVDYRSTVDGVMHACGHDAHTTVVLGAVMVLREMEQAGKLPWPVACRAIFQPAEESNRGALEMIEAGAIDGLTHLIGLHVDPSRRVGTIGVRYGDFTADCHELEIVIHGRGAHAARPHESIDPIAIAAQLISSIYLFVPRSTDSQDPVVITFGQIHGGLAANVIPDQVIIRGTLRTQEAAISSETIRHIERLARGLGDASGAKITVGWQSGPPPVKNDSALVDLIATAGGSVLDEAHVQTIRRPSMGGEDFANYLTRLRGAMFRLGCATDPIIAPPLHSPLFDIDERALAIGAEIFAQAVIRWSEPRHPNQLFC
ncbi:MAG: amidohydrolase [Planctomycetaceae bacterium]|nr:MAG: amidohydrolase [Planctomycetaceae bacterium]